MVLFLPISSGDTECCTKFHRNILDGIKVRERTRFSYTKISRGHNSVKMLVELSFLFLCTLSDQNQNQNCLLVIRPRTIIHQDLCLGKLVPSPHKRSKLSN